MERAANATAPVAVIVDSTSSLTPAETAGLPLEIVPLIITVAGRSYVDGVDLSSAEFYAMIQDDAAPAHTGAPGPSAFTTAFVRAFEAGADALCITASSGLSATHAMAQEGLAAALAQHPSARGVVLDSGTAGGAEALIALAAARTAAHGAPLDDVVQRAQAEAACAYFIGALDSFGRLQHSGRVPRIAAWAATALSIKPVLAIWPGGGQIRMIARPRTKARAIERMLQVIADESRGDPIRAAVMHAAAPHEAEELRQRLLERFPCREVLVLPFTPVIGAHTGPGLLALGFSHARAGYDPHDASGAADSPP